MARLYSQEELLDLLYSELISKIDKLNSYAFKGGYVLSNYLAVDEARMTTDIDMSIAGIPDFKNIVNILLPLLNNLKATNQITKYTIKEPKVAKSRNVSGSIKLFRKLDIDGVPKGNKPTVVVCGIDISIHDLSFGLMLQRDGVVSFSFERMLSDKISVLYTNKDTISRRCRDLYDIFLFDYFSVVIDINIMKDCLAYRNIDISSVSHFEEVLKSDYAFIADSIKDLLDDGKRASLGFVVSNNLSPSLIINKVLSVLDTLRGCI